jgi:thiamine biosynthesis lipoprotein
MLGRPAYVGVVCANPTLLDEANTRLSELDRKWRPDGPGSELARLVAYPGVAHHVSADTVLLAELDARRPGEPASLYVDSAHGSVGLLANQPVHLGGLAAALATDLILIDLVEAGAAGACVRIGPNTRAIGASPQRRGWSADLKRPLRIQQGAVSTVDTRRSSVGRRRSATVVADQAWRAHSLAGAALRLNNEHARTLLTEAGVAARIVALDGTEITVGAWASFAAA